MKRDWLDQIKRRAELDINQPVAIPDAKAPLPDKTKLKPSTPWRQYMRTKRARRWLLKERQA